MKRKSLVIISIAAVLCMLSNTVAFAADDYELPSIPITHRFGEWEVTKEPTCIKEGRKTRYCSHCSAKETEIIPALGHEFGEWAETQPESLPDCTHAGATAVEERVCSRCKVIETRGGEIINALGHSYETAVTQPTCTEKGYTTYSCTRCDSTYVSDYTDSKGHTPSAPVQENIVDNSHEDGGSYDSVVYCSVCHAELSREKIHTPAAGHVPAKAVQENIVKASCTVDGSYDEVVYCQDCSAELSRIKKTIPAEGHKFSDWQQSAAEVKPTCTQAGATATETHICSECDLIETRGGDVINALGHNYQTAVTPPSCTETGYTTYSCTRCDSVYVSDYTNALGHTPSEEVKENVVEATTSAAGSYEAVIYCSECGAEISRKVNTIPKKTLPDGGDDFDTEPLPFDDDDKKEIPSKPSTPTTKVTKPKAPSIKKLKKGRKSFKVTWKKVSSVNGYQIQYSTNKKFKKGKKQTVKAVTVKKAKATSKTVKKLKAKKKYYVRIRSYKIVNGKKVYSKWSKIKAVKTK